MASHMIFPFSSLFSLAYLHCGGNYTDPEGLISSDLSGPFTHSRQCIYVITQPLGEQIQVNFTHVELESQNGCSHSYIEVTFTTLRPFNDVYQHFSILYSLVVFKWPQGQQHADSPDDLDVRNAMLCPISDLLNQNLLGDAQSSAPQPSQ